MTLPLYRRHRPDNIDDVLGNDSMKEALTQVVSRQEGRPTTYLFSGPSGCGKTTLARIISEILGAGGMDLYEFNISKQGGINEARTIIEDVSYSTFGGGSKVIILNECHKANKNFQNAMLEVLEEPPENVYFILCTTEPEMLLTTIRTRCTPFKVSLLSSRIGTVLVKKVLKWERKNLGKKVIREVVKSGGGSPRQILVNLDLVIDMEDEDEAIDVLAGIRVSDADIKDLCMALLGKHKWKDVSKMLKSMQGDPEGIRMRVLAWMNKTLLDGKPRASEIITEFSEPFYQDALLTNACFSLIIFNED